MNCAAGRADHLDGLGDLAPVGFLELAEVVFGSADELPQPGDLFVGGHGLGFGPLVVVLGGPDAFAGSQQGVEVVAKLGQVGGVGAEVAAAQATEPDGQAPPPALALEGSEDTPNGTAIWPTARCWCSRSRRAPAWLQTRSPPRSNWKAARVSTAARRVEHRGLPLCCRRPRASSPVERAWHRCIASGCPDLGSYQGEPALPT